MESITNVGAMATEWHTWATNINSEPQHESFVCVFCARTISGGCDACKDHIVGVGTHVTACQGPVAAVSDDSGMTEGLRSLWKDAKNTILGEKAQESRTDRLREELTQWPCELKAPEASVSLQDWQCTIPGPAKSPWNKRFLGVQITFPDQYPSVPPACRFTSRLFHPNISPDGLIRHCCTWTSNTTISDVLAEIQQVLAQPKLTAILNPRALHDCCHDRAEYNRRARASISTIEMLPFDVMGCIVNEYLDLSDAISLSMTSHWGRLAAHTLRLQLPKVLLASFSTDAAWPLVSAEYVEFDHLMSHTEISRFLDSVAMPRGLGVSITFFAKHFPCVVKATGLKHLSLHGCFPLSTLPKTILNLSNLTSLRLIDCIALMLPEWLGKMQSLQSLTISLRIKTLPDSIGQLNSLTSLNLQQCTELTSLPESLCLLKSLTSLALEAPALNSLPEGIGQLSCLTSLDLRLNLGSLPESIGQLSSLTSLILQAGNLTSLPESIGQLSSLTRLELVECHCLRSLPESIGQLSSLRNLTFESCPLTSLPESIGQLSSLTSLILQAGNVTSLPESIGQLSSLTRLELVECRCLRSMPESIGQLSSLTRLELVACRCLRSMPESIGQLSSLTNLNLAYCSMVSLPESIGQLSSLTNLTVERCPLTSLPESIGQLSSLTSLSLCQCYALKTLPESIGQLRSLRTLDLVRCRSLRPPPNSCRGLSLTVLHLSLGHGQITLRGSKLSAWLKELPPWDWEKA